MTISTTTPRVAYSGNGATTVFPVPIQAYLASDFTVIVTQSQANGAGEQTYTLNSDYSLVTTGTQTPPLWTLTTLSATPLPAGTVLTILLNPVQQQQTQYVQGQAFPSLSVQTALDRAVQLCQRLSDQLTRTIHAPDGDQFTGNFLLPVSAARANQYLGFDANGNVSLSTLLVAGTALSASVVGGYIYPQSQGESNAGVTPVLLQYKWGDVRRYGAVADSGVTNNQLKFQQCINANAGYYAITIPNNGTGYYGGFTTCLNVPAQTTFAFEDGAELRWTSTTAASGGLLQGSATRPGFNLQGGDIRFIGRGIITGPSKQIGLNGAPGASFPATASGGVYVSLEIGIFAAGTSIAAPFSNIEISDGIEVRWWGYDGITLAYCNNATVRDCYIHDCAYHGVLFMSCVNSSVHHNKVQYIDPGTGSGLNNCYGISLTAYPLNATSGQNRADANASCIGCSVTNNTVLDIPRWSGIDAHGGFELTYRDNVVYNCWSGITVGSFPGLGGTNVYGSENCDISNNKIYLKQQTGAATLVGVAPFAQAGNNPGYGINMSGGQGGGGTNTLALHPRATDNAIDGYGTIGLPGSSIAIYSYATYDAVIEGNVIDNWAGVAIYLQGSTGGIVAANQFGQLNASQASDTCIFLNTQTTPPIFFGNQHNISVGTKAHFGLTVYTALTCQVGINDFSSATTAQYGNSSGGALTPAAFLGQANPLVVGAVIGTGAPLGTPIQAILKGTQAVAGTATQAVAFGVTLPAATYQIKFSQSASSPLPPWWTAKTTTGFTINFSAAFTGSVDWEISL